MTFADDGEIGTKEYYKNRCEELEKTIKLLHKEKAKLMERIQELEATIRYIHPSNA